MQLKVTTNAAAVNRWLGNVSDKKIAQAGKAALSKVVLQVQAAERIEMRKRFTIRRAAFMRNRVKIFKFPRWQDGGAMVAIIGIDDRVRGSRLLFSTMADDNGARMKSPVEGSRVAIPLTGGKARQVFRKSVPTAYRLDRLALRSDLSTRQVKGNKRTFILPTKTGDFALFQRGGGGGTGADKDMSPLYLFKTRVPLKQRMKFAKIAVELAEEQLPKMFARYLRLYVKQ